LGRTFYSIGMHPRDDDVPAGGSTCCQPCNNYAAPIPLSDTQPEKLDSSLSAARHDAWLKTQIQAATSGPVPAILPGTDAMGVGYDVVKGQTRGLRAVNLTYDHQQTWTDPFFHITYLVPDQVNVQPSPGGSYNGWEFRSVSEYVHRLSIDVGINVDLGVLQLSADVQDARTSMQDHQSTLHLGRDALTSYEIIFAGGASIQHASIVFLQSVDLLPTSYDPVAYADFIATWGTHIVTDAIYGGLATQRSYVAQSYTANSDVVDANAALVFAHFKDGSNRTDHTFSSYAVSHFEVQGGSFQLYRPGDWDQWKLSVHLTPTQVSKQLTPVWVFVTDRTKKAGLKRAVADYYAQNKQPDVSVPPFAVQSTTFQGACPDDDSLTRDNSTADALPRGNDGCYSQGCDTRGVVFGFSDYGMGDRVKCPYVCAAVSFVNSTMPSIYTMPVQPTDHNMCPEGSFVYRYPYCHHYNYIFRIYNSPQGAVECAALVYNQQRA